VKNPRRLPPRLRRFRDLRVRLVKRREELALTIRRFDDAVTEIDKTLGPEDREQ
jgi:hypothetical protein